MNTKKNILKSLFFLIGLAFFIDGIAQATQVLQATDLTVFEIKGRKSPFRTNLLFAGYKTSGITRTPGSIFYITNINLLNPIFEIDGIPLLNTQKQRRKDVFRFDLKSNDKEVAIMKCRAVMKKNETFRLLQKQDSSFWGNKNTDILVAQIQLCNTTAGQWNLVASNLNASRNEDQKGIIRNRNNTAEISFHLLNLVLKESSDTDKPTHLFSMLNMVYAFSYQDTIIGAVSVKEAGRKFWLKENLPGDIKDVVATVAAILTIRLNLYK